MRTYAREAQALSDTGPVNYYKQRLGFNRDMSSGIAALDSCFGNLDRSYEVLRQRRLMADPRMTYGANLFAIEQAVDKFADEAPRLFASTRAKLEASTAAADAKLKATVGIGPTRDTDAIRAVLRGLPAKKLLETLTKAFADGDKEIIGAVVNCHHLLSGCDPTMVAELFDAYQRRVAPNEYAALAEHKRAREVLDKSELITMQATARLYAGTEVAAAKRREIATMLNSYGMGLGDPAPHGAGFEGEPAE